MEGCLQTRPEFVVQTLRVCNHLHGFLCGLSTSTLLATSTALIGVVYALCRSRKRLLPHVLDWGNLKLCVGGRGVCHERHRRHLLLDSHLIGCQLVDCCGYFQRDRCCSSVHVPDGAACHVRSCLCDRGCIVGRVCVLVLVLIRQHVEHVCASL
jgi:hypothetical protein